jgi:hypothetical protein
MLQSHRPKVWILEGWRIVAIFMIYQTSLNHSHFPMLPCEHEYDWYYPMTPKFSSITSSGLKPSILWFTSGLYYVTWEMFYFQILAPINLKDKLFAPTHVHTYYTIERGRLTSMNSSTQKREDERLILILKHSNLDFCWANVSRFLYPESGKIPYPALGSSPWKWFPSSWISDSWFHPLDHPSLSTTFLCYFWRRSLCW